MSKFKILALSVDGRPVTREQVQLLARIADCELLCPPVESLGYFRQPADRDQLADWVMQNAASADGFIFSLDMLVYGGLVPSRFIEDVGPSLEARLELLKDLKQHYPDKPLYGFCATMRMSNNNENEEEKLYWAQHGTDIWSWSYFSDRYACLHDQEDKERAEKARVKIPETIQRDYLSTRARNFSVTQKVLAMVEDKIIDRLVLPQDDTAEYGFNIGERRQLQSWVARKQLHDNVLIYPGADEVIYTLLAHQVQVLEQRRHNSVSPIKIAVRAHHPSALAAMVARYEDRPVMESIHCQVDAAGAVIVECEEEADVVLAVHCRGKVQGDWAMQYPLSEDLGLDDEWLAKLQRDVREAHRPIAILDLAYANGGDPELLSVLEDTSNVRLSTLQGYSGWNTASNSIGSLVAQLCFSVSPQSQAHSTENSREQNRHLLAIRLLDDYLYQSRFRQILRERQQSLSLADGDIELLREVYLDTARQWLQQQGFTDVVLDDVYFPWRRSFEVGLSTLLTQTSRQLSVEASA
uniref:DUF4127 family protein n=1 Tax=Microbulbifer agarilyticus TaxID=260552 RepID=UPI0002558A71|nr:DUF4127 family protein [Microbulbifer agarilyticus]